MQLENKISRTKFGTFLLLICCFLCLYTLTFNGVFRLDDEHILAARTQSLALWGEFSEPQVYGNQRVQALIPLGDPATQIEPGQAVLGAILVRIAQVLHLGIAQALFSLNIILTALCVGVVFLIVSELGYSRRVAIWCAMFFGAGSMTWPYAMTYFRDTLAMTMSALVFLGWARFQQAQADDRGKALFLVGIGAVVGVLTKNNVAVLIAALGVVGFVRWLHTPKVRKEWIKGILMGLFAILGVLGVLMLLPGDGPFARFSLDYYLFLAKHFLESIDVDLLASILGPFFSPAKSIFLYSPPLLFGLISIRPILRTKDREFTMLALLFTLFLAIAQGLFYRERWSGGFGWGLKYMLPAFPALIPLLAPAIASKMDRDSHNGTIWLAGFLALSMLVQLGGVLVPWNHAYNHWQAQGLDPYTVSAAWSARFLAIPTQLLGLCAISQWSIAWRRLLSTKTVYVSSVFFITLLIMGISVRGLYKFGSLLWSKRWFPLIFTLLVLILLPMTTWWAVRGDPAWGEDHVAFQTALITVRDEISENGVILLDSYGTTLWHYWMNHWDRPQRWYSLPFSIPGPLQGGDFESPPAVELESLIVRLKESADSLWYVTSSETADYEANPDRHWIESLLSLDSCILFDGGIQVEVCKFTNP